jgi:hypothetical protein
MESDLLLLNSTRDLCRLAEKVEILSDRRGGSFRVASAATKGVIVEGIVGFVKLVTKTVISILKLKGSLYIIASREAGEGVVGLGEARSRRVVARHNDDGWE